MSRPFIPAPNTVSVELIYGVFSQVVENVFHVENNAPFTLAQIQTLRGVFDNWDNVTWKTWRHNLILLNRIRIKALDTINSPFEDYNLPAPRAGTQGNAQYPLNVTFAVKLASTQAGRSARGRIYVPGLYTTAVSNNQVTQAFANGIVAALTTLMANIVASSANQKLVITSYRANKAWRGTAVNFPVATVAAVDLNIDSQRRRLTGRGRA